MKYIYIAITVLFIQYSFAQSGVNEKDIQDFKEKSPFKGELSKHDVPLDYTTNNKEKINEDTLVDNPLKDQLNSWDRVYSTPEAQSLQNKDVPYQSGEDTTALLSSYDRDDTTDWHGIIITVGVVVLALFAGIFLYKLFKQ